MKKCRICGRELVLKADPFCPEEWVKALSSVPMCCQPCGDYGWRRLRLREAMQRTCIQVMAQRQPPTDKQRTGIMGYTRRYARLVCDFYHVRMQWEEQFPDMILVSPQGCLRVLEEFERGVASQAGVPVAKAEPIRRVAPGAVIA